jgi:hypothetical protein
VPLSLADTLFAGAQTVATSENLAANTITAVRFPAGVTAPVLLPKVKAHGAELAGSSFTPSPAPFCFSWVGGDKEKGSQCRYLLV